MKHVVMFSGGIGSWATAKRVAEDHGTADLVLLFADVKGNTDNPHIGEDEDTYRFIKDAAANVGGELVTVMDGRNIWEVFRDKRFLGNSRQANCSHTLKQKPCRDWLEANCPDGSAIVYVGIDWSEKHRLKAVERAYLPYIAKAPLTEPPYLDKEDMLKWAESEGLDPPRAYALGFPHNNCGGGCVRAGQGQFKRLLEVNPERYAVWEREEQGIRDYLDKDVTILRDFTKKGVEAYCDANGLPRLVPVEVSTDYEIDDYGNEIAVAWETVMKPPISLAPLTLREMRQRIQGTSDGEVDTDDIGGCGCFVDVEEGAPDEENEKQRQHEEIVEEDKRQKEEKVAPRRRQNAPRKEVWLNPIERDAWVEKNCRTCFQPDEALRRITGDGPGCPHLARAEAGKLPTPWTRRRNAVMGETYRCAEYAPKPPVNRRPTVVEDIEPMLDVEPDDRHLVPVEGWPDWKAEAKKTKDGDHQ